MRIRTDDIIRIRVVPSFKVYDEDTGYGFLRHVLIRTGHIYREWCW